MGCGIAHKQRSTDELARVDPLRPVTGTAAAAEPRADEASLGLLVVLPDAWNWSVDPPELGRSLVARDLIHVCSALGMPAAVARLCSPAVLAPPPRPAPSARPGDRNHRGPRDGL